MADDPLITDTSDEAQLALADRLVRDDVRRDHELWRLVLGTYEGREFLWRLLGRLPGTEDIHGEQAFVYRQLGRRSVWLELEIEIAKHPELMLQMRNEAVKRDQQRRRELASSRVKRTTRRDTE